MRFFRKILIGLSALILVGCGDGGVQSPDFTGELQELRIVPLAATVAAGRTTQFTAMGVYTLPPGSDSPTEERPVSGVDWTVDSANASIDGNGLATGLLVGIAQIGASLDGVDAAAPATLTITAAELDSIAIEPDGATIPLGGSQVFTATGTFSDGSTAPVSVDWTSSNVGTATVSPATGTSTTATSVAEGTTTLTATSGTIQDSVTVTVGPFQPALVSMTISPDPAPPQPVGRPLQFSVAGQCTTAPFSSTTGACTPTNVVWTVADSTIAMIDADSGVATGSRIGTTQITATSGTITDSVTFEVSEAVIESLTITPSSQSLAVGGSQQFTATAVFSDGSSGPVVVDWTSSDTAVATVLPANGATTTATAVGVGSATITAATTNSLGEPITAEAVLTVTGVVLEDLLRVETADGQAQGRTTPGRSVEFVAIGQFSDGSEAPIDDANITWTSSDVAIATVDAQGFATGEDQGQVQIRAARVDAPADTAFALLTVTDAVCTTPLLSIPDGANAVEFTTPLCVGCTVDNESNLTNADPDDFTTISSPVGLLGAEVGVTVGPPTTPTYTVPFAAGGNAGFVIGKPAGTLVLAEVLSQVYVNTLLNGAVQETTTGGSMPLRVELLGIQLTGAIDTALVSLATSLPYDAIQLGVNSGTASALSTVQVFQACATSEPPAPAAELTGVARIEPAVTSLSAGAAKNLVVFGSYSDGSEAELSDADIDWSTSDAALATVNANGVVSGVAPGSVTVTATLKTGVAPSVTDRDAQSEVTVLPAVCTAPMLASEGATVSESSSLLCLLCSVSNTANIIGASPTTFGTIHVPLGLLNATSEVTVSSNSPTDFPAGGTAGFVIARPVGAILEAEVLSQIQVSTLLNGSVQQTSGPSIPLRADLLGLALTGGGGDTALVTLQPTLPYDALRLTFVSGLATVGLLENKLQTVNVFQACSSATPPPSAP